MAAVAVADGGRRVGDLMRAARAAKLLDRLDDGEDAVYVRMHAGETAAVGVDRTAAAGRGAAVFDERPAFPLVQKPRSSRNMIGLIENAS